MNETREALAAVPIVEHGSAPVGVGTLAEATPAPAASSRADAGGSEEGGPCLIGIVGDSGSGKSTVADAVTALLSQDQVTQLWLDDYHRFTRDERMERGMTALNPAVHNLPLMYEHLLLLRQGRQIRNRSYNHADGSFGPIRVIEPAQIVLVRGLLGFPTDELQELYHLSVFLQPEPELLFRWKLRRDVQSRGYTEAEVLKNIVQHLLDSKQFVLPQAERADVVVRYELPGWDAPDDQIRTSLRLRRRAAELAKETDLIAGLGQAAHQQVSEDEVLIELGNELTQEEVDAWAGALYPETYVPRRIGAYTDDVGASPTRPPLAGVEVLIARLASALRCAGAGA